MQVQALQGYFENGVFYQLGEPVNLPERMMVIVNVLDMPVDVNKKTDIDFWKAFDELAYNSVDEQLSEDDFPRVNFNRDFIVFDDEGQQAI